MSPFFFLNVAYFFYMVYSVFTIRDICSLTEFAAFMSLRGARTKSFDLFQKARLPSTFFSYVLISVFSGQSLVVERLSKEKAEYGSRYINLLATTNIPIFFRKVITPYTWGGMINDVVHCSNAITGGSLDAHLRNRRNRLVYAQMLSECMEV